MNLNRILILWLTITSLLFSCKSVQQTATPAENTEVTENEAEPQVSLEKEASPVKDLKYQAEQTKKFDLVHTKLEVSFDWAKRYLYGKATIQLKPHFYPQDSLVLDAKSFAINKVQMVNGSDVSELTYNYDGKKLRIYLGKTVSRNDLVTVKIDYTAKPYEREVGGSEAITEDRGLYFINPDGTEEGKPQEIWTQGETEASSCWFPTIDAPNQKTTEEIYITVDEKFKTLSNGDLIYSQINGDGTKTDYWKMDKPHAPYLFMMAVGDFAVYEDEWKGMPVNYYVEQKYGPYAKDIFGNTPEMIGYFGDLLNYPFPWSKYSQVVVREYVSGAMENTTATVFMEELQMTKRELLDENYDYIIAHELFHQWFGDLVTCESWSNLTLNEGFATYAEYLWEAHKEGKEAGEYKLYEELNSYLGEAETEEKDLIRFYYNDKEDMFDNHSYAKGGLVLHMLRDYVGDEAFFKSLNYYLNQNKYQDVEVHNLRLAFEEVTGEDLNWFFNEWYLDNGHPKLKVTQNYIDSTKTLNVRVEQMQDTKEYPVYKIPVDVEIWNGGKKQQKVVWVDKIQNEYNFSLSGKPSLFLFNSNEDIIAEVDQQKTSDEWAFQAEHAENVVARLKAYKALANDSTIDASGVFYKGLSDSFPEIQKAAIAYAQQSGDSLMTAWEDNISKLAKSSDDTGVRSDAIFALFETFGDKYHDLYVEAANDSSYLVAGSGLYAELQSPNFDHDKLVENFIDEENVNIVLPLANYFIVSKDSTKFDWFAHQIKAGGTEAKYYLLRMVGQYMMMVNDEQLKKGIELLYDFAKNDTKYYLRIAALQALQLFEDDSELAKKKLSDLKSTETDERVKQFLN